MGLLLDGGQRLLRENEDDRDGPQLGDHHQAVGVVGMDDIALVHQPETRAPVNGGPDGGVGQQDLGAFDGRLVRVGRGY